MLSVKRGVEPLAFLISRPYYEQERHTNIHTWVLDCTYEIIYPKIFPEIRSYKQAAFLDQRWNLFWDKEQFRALFSTHDASYWTNQIQPLLYQLQLRIASQSLLTVEVNSYTLELSFDYVNSESSYRKGQGTQSHSIFVVMPHGKHPRIQQHWASRLSSLFCFLVVTMTYFR